MKVRELIMRLNDYDPDAEIVIWNETETSPAALPIDEIRKIDDAALVRSIRKHYPQVGEKVVVLL